jgi:Uma2 family endonuclease
MSLGYTRSMRAVMLEVPEELLAERRRKGQDKRDEVWAGVLHMVPPSSFQHNCIARDLLYVLRQLARPRELIEIYETGVFDPAAGETNYRVPDLALVTPEQISKRGVEGAALVVEILSPDDESLDKLPFYARVGVREAWLLDPATRSLGLFVLQAGELMPVAPQQGAWRSPLLGVELSTTVTPTLRIVDGTRVDEV